MAKLTKAIIEFDDEGFISDETKPANGNLNFWTAVYSCSACGALVTVYDKDLHREWHKVSRSGADRG